MTGYNLRRVIQLPDQFVGQLLATDSYKLWSKGISLLGQEPDTRVGENGCQVELAPATRDHIQRLSSNRSGRACDAYLNQCDLQRMR